MTDVPAKPLSAHGERLAALDGLRGFAVLWVMLHHFLHGATHGNLLVGGIFTFIHYGYWGVDVFFVLSGFLITGILFDTKNADNYYSSFYARRALRILPLYYGVIFAVFVVAPFIIQYTAAQRALCSEQIWLWLYVGNIAMVVKKAPIYDAGGIKLLHLWSLAIEEQFYLLWPLVVYYCSRRRLIQVCFGLCALAMVSRITVDYLGAAKVTASFFTLSRVDGLALGALAAMLARSPGGLAARVGFARRLAAVSCVLVVVLLYTQAKVGWVDSPAGYGISLIRLGLFMAVLMLAVGGPPGGWTRRAFSQKWLIFFGKYSYGLYVFHYMMLPIFDRYFSAQRLESLLFGRFIAGMAARMIICTGISLVVALLSWHLFEKHFLKFKDRYAPHRTALPPAEVAPSEHALATATGTTAKAT